MKKTFDVRAVPVPVSALRRSMTLGLLLAPLVAVAQTPKVGVKPVVRVWKSAACGCCGDWIAHLRQNGFDVVAGNVDDLAAARRSVRMPDRYASCHTALVDGYALEGHVPASDVSRLLRERPKAIGLAVPGMPVGSPGMDGPAYGGRKDRYDVVLVGIDGNGRVFHAYG
ncbi:hypothetical protein C7408_104282 [Paraburkholderia caballeronis]|nr:hypothetical protein C7406_106161 [Paraburkholderia caballeronis]TDV17621.1 hypothetical protein C7408_104282 [Paraburkholderia caballeronis]TDV27639.1 hypothetical protein C7404_104282 [Paraburkholderia caballeronis]TDV36376.1 hypothetical protein C7405_104288 [Paraburkholderia caballeronis]